jgi:2,4-dienoyl-CoA reductase-like NADH-dependent reductase (Old Yellow Enzyme family)
MLGDELTGAQIQELIKAFADSARNAREVGADGVQIHAAHGYLVSQFLSPLTNLRKDEWGGTLEGRAKFLRSIIRAVRELIGADFPLGVKLGACDDDPSGLKIEETLQIAKWLEEDGIDFIEISGGFRSDISRRRVGPGKNEGYYLSFAEQFKKALKIPVIAVGGLRSLEKMNEALSLNQCDAVSMSRPLICQPDLPMILRAGGKSECRGCNLCLMKHDQPTACHAKK